FLGGVFLSAVFTFGAFLTGVSLTGAFLTGVSLTGAFLTGAFLPGAFFLVAFFLAEAVDFLGSGTGFSVGGVISTRATIRPQAGQAASLSLLFKREAIAVGICMRQIVHTPSKIIVSPIPDRDPRSRLYLRSSIDGMPFSTSVRFFSSRRILERNLRISASGPC
ncbi:MAG: pentapeptide repeat-containing protein, partial [Proteobacteria bacterium]|nr:pentapeptide repeat-containing protein [Pseudomonadota bacterium]